ncbi:hypothetical protein [Pedobacter heparinus]|uniref:Uncharacterized protein n=1 Tax=Pedobacter heparinus (strain ATCC 13125 / DSM 2366 / CIP 104194 / JCM 7457 / NBRC 12017 / NCIMB 9290 / NRRL B-14731 / HIM 762-3) TaxID=485917 RepID=C6Y3P6_PEDHD|nr:hypothetical protein [Pedobacter heparinus]ACU03325.1 hypothetical protein Phep_1107 [Pedobacter heparinus DSM 2366]
MKHKKALLYLLGFLVICIWGIIIMRVYAAVGTDKALLPALNIAGDTIKTHVPVLQPDTFQLQLGYADPFKELETEGQQSAVSVAQVAAGTVQPIRPVPAAPMLKPVNTRYLGYVWNAGNRKKVAIMNQNGRELMLEEGGLIDELQLISISSDSVKVKYKGKTSFIRINK